MKEIQTKSGKILIVEVPKLAFYFDLQVAEKLKKELE